jgi:phage tail sheath protein FI
MAEIRTHLNLMPPAAAMAGVYARTDGLVGVFKAPANTSIVGVASPAVALSDADQRDLNAPIIGGVAVNAIRSFVGRGVLVWGARTMDGNSQDWRYVNVRRTAIMLEQSMKNALQAYVFEPNTASTWTTVRNMLSNFLDNQWKAGALMGAVPEDAYRVDVGLGTTMTPTDVLDGYMKVVVRVALVRPAEFIVLTFQQKLPAS